MQCEVEETAVCVARLQKTQQEKKPVHSLWRKVQEHSGMRGMPPKGAALEERGWKTKGEIVTFVKYRGYEYKGCHKLHSVISPSILRQFPRSQSQPKALMKTF